MESLLKVRDLHIEGMSDEKWRPIIKGVDLTLAKGEVLGLIGESGAGKSTMGIASMGFTRQGCRISSGSVIFNGKELVGAPEKELRQIWGNRIAYVAQSAAASFNPAFRLFRQYAEAPVHHGIMTYEQAEKEAVDIYSRLLLPDPENIGYRYPHQVSGGQLQRAMVAMAMACQPDIIVFDEPTTALDVTTQIEVLGAVKKVVNELNTAAIYITHDLAVVAQIADRIMVMRDGHLVEENSAGEILSSPREPYTRKLLSVRMPGEDDPLTISGEDVVLQVNDVTAGYSDKRKVLKNIHLTVRRGRTIALVGESGSGKSTLAKVITGLLPPTRGTISYNGVALAPGLKQRQKEELRRLQLIHQMPDTSLNPRHKVSKIIGRPLQFYFGMDERKRKKRVLELLDRIEMPGRYYDRYPSELSGGEKQRICIARALAADPEFIICDEVTSALDQLVAEGILRLLQDLQNELKIAYLFITHDLATVKAISHEIVVMFQGKIVEQGLKKDVLSPPHHAYTELLLSSIPEMDIDWLDKLMLKRSGIMASG